MLDIQQLRSNLDAVVAGLARRGKPIDFAGFTALEAERKTLQTRTQELQAQRNSLSKQIGMLKGQGKDASEVMAQVGALGDELKASELRLGELLDKFNAILAGLPNIPDESVPDGADESANVEIKRWGTPRTFPGPDHLHRRRRRCFPAAHPEGRWPGEIRRHAAVLPRQAPVGLRRQEPGDRRRRRLGD